MREMLHLGKVVRIHSMYCICRAFRELQPRIGFCLAYDITLNPDNMDICSTWGFVNMLAVCFRVEAGCMTFWAPVCSTWVWMSRSSTWRRIWRPLGNESFATVRNANIMVSRVALCLHILAIRCVIWAVEQPLTSVLRL